MRTALSHRPSLVVTALVLAILLVPYTFTSAAIEDELNTLVSAARMIQGQVLYRDFFDYTAPMPNWLAAGVFLLTGPSLLAARTLQSIGLWIAGVQLYALGRRLAIPPWTAMLAPLGFLLVYYRIWPGYSHHWLALPFILAATHAALSGAVTRRSRAWVLAGVATGGTCLCMQSDGPVLAIAQVALLGLLPWVAGWTIRQALGAALAFVAGLLLPLALAALILASQGALFAAWTDAWLYLLGHYNKGNVNVMPFATDLPMLLLPVTSLPGWYARAFHYIVLIGLLPGAALGALAWGAGALFARWRGDTERWDEARLGLGLVGLLSIGFLLLACRGRADFIHVAIYSIPAFLLATVAATRCTTWPIAGQRVLLHVPLALLVAFIGTGAGMWASAMRANPEAWLRLESPDARLAALPAVTYLREHTAQNDTVVVAPYGGLYYLYARPPGTRYTLILPPVAGYMSDKQLEEVYTDVAVRRPKYVIYVPWQGGDWIVPHYRQRPLPGYRETALLPGFPPGTATFIRVDAR